jgi:antitoxin (DNA-binding transcriptional repressor) of toxin-antitoxin stability system
MKTVGLRALKNELSRWVAEVRRGEVVLITDRSRIVAELRPPGGVGLPGADPGLERMADRGELTLGLAHDASLYTRLGPCAPPGTAAALLDEEREGT